MTPKPVDRAMVVQSSLQEADTEGPAGGQGGEATMGSVVPEQPMMDPPSEPYEPTSNDKWLGYAVTNVTIFGLAYLATELQRQLNPYVLGSGKNAGIWLWLAINQLLLATVRDILGYITVEMVFAHVPFFHGAAAVPSKRTFKKYIYCTTEGWMDRVSLFLNLLVAIMSGMCFYGTPNLQVLTETNHCPWIEYTAKLFMIDLMADLSTYATHRLFHEVPSLYQLHKTHHDDHEVTIIWQAVHNNVVDQLTNVFATGWPVGLFFFLRQTWFGNWLGDMSMMQMHMAYYAAIQKGFSWHCGKPLPIYSSIFFAPSLSELMRGYSAVDTIRHHDQHHRLQNVHFGTSPNTDRFFGTDEHSARRRRARTQGTSAAAELR